ncbi:hypothetical protein KUW00_15585 [Halomonas sp. DP5N14-9]|uniref:hypothetical protein n=1 Tax=Halomonas sp. DP5N14-9 TaxID=2859075 RepID=UPI001C9A01B7|nr:hypothetical protein [Halomonas sp. DP5N14-9]MBY5942301.1 hypothetical protein [Halomonas sp. DP5N14-9]
MSSSRQLAEHGDRTDDPHNVTPGQAGADPAGTASSEVSAHEAKSGAHTPAQVGADPAGSAASAESAAKSHADTKASEAQAHAVQRSNHTGTQTLATISDAGTAASRNVATAHADSDTTKVPLIGAAGLLNAVNLLEPGGEFSNNKPIGLYHINVADAAGAGLPAQYGSLFSCGHPSNARNFKGWGQELMFDINGVIYHRHSGSNSGAGYTAPINWAKWRFLYNSMNAVQPVSMDASGVPSGGLFEYGSNSNGEYLKFADGTLICFVEVDGLGTTTAVPGSNGSLFHSADQTWTFPAAFVEKPVMDVTGIRHSDDSIIVWGVGRTTTGSTTKLRGVASQSSAAIGYYLHATAKGRWYN